MTANRVWASSLLLCAISVSVSVATSQRPEQAPATAARAKNDLSFSGSNHRHSHHFVSTPNVVTVAPIVLETHEIVQNQPSRFSFAAGERHSASYTVPSSVTLPVNHVGALPPGSHVTAPLSHGPPVHHVDALAAAVSANPVLAALLLSSLLGLSTHAAGSNSLEHQPPNPYVALLLSHYGRYVTRPGHLAHGIYGYSASNNIHNTRPFGSYKIYEDSS